MKKLINLLLPLLLLSLISCENKKATTPIPENIEQPQEQQVVEKKYKYICSESEIFVRSIPKLTRNSFKRGVLKLYDKVEVLEVTSELEEINNVKNYWFKVKYEKIEGWVFGANLVDTLEEAQKAEYFNGIWIADKLEYVDENIVNYQINTENERINIEFNGFDYEKKNLIFKITYKNISLINAMDEYISLMYGENGPQSLIIGIDIKDNQKVILRKNENMLSYDFDNDMEVIGGYKYSFDLLMKKSCRKYVCSSDKINVRSSPDEASEVIGCLKNYDVVSVLEKTADLEEINKIKAYWFNIKAEDVSGWVFGGYLVNTLDEVKKVEYLNGTWVGDKLVFVDDDIYNYSINIDNESVDIIYYGFDYVINDLMFKIKYDKYELFQPVGNVIKVYYYEWGNDLFDYKIYFEKGVEMYFEKYANEIEFDFEKEERIGGYRYCYGFTLKKLKD